MIYTTRKDCDLVFIIMKLIDDKKDVDLLSFIMTVVIVGLTSVMPLCILR